MTGPGMIPDAGMDYLTPLDRLERIRSSARAAKAASEAMCKLNVHDDAARDVLLEAHDEACTEMIDLICDPAAQEMFCEIEAYLQVSFGRAG